MKVSFDGLRKNATRSMNKLYDVLEDILKNEDICEDNKFQIIEKFNEAAMFVDSFNCIFDPDVEDDINDLSNLSIDRLAEQCNDKEDEDE